MYTPVELPVTLVFHCIQRQSVISKYICDFFFTLTLLAI